MKPIAFAALLLLPAALHAATWTVDNNPNRPANFRTIQEAADAAEQGDTILIAGSETPYDIVYLRKRLNLYGPGYWLAENDIPAPGLSAKIVMLSLDSGTDPFLPDYGYSSAGSVIEGIEFGSNWLSINTENNRLARIKAERISVNAPGNRISHSWIDDEVRLEGETPVTPGASGSVLLSNRIGSILIDSQIVAYCEFCIFTRQGSSGYPIASPANNTATIRNSIFVAPQEYSGTLSGVVFDHCMAIGTVTLPAGNGNTNLAANQLSNVFQLGTETDRRFLLKAGSPAIGTGKDGADRGMFGGPSPYVISGIPARPRVTFLSVPGLAPDSTGLIFEVEGEARD